MKAILITAIALYGSTLLAEPVTSIDLNFPCPQQDVEYQDGLSPRRETTVYLNGNLIAVEDSRFAREGAQVILEGNKVLLASVKNMSSRIVLGQFAGDLEQYRDAQPACQPIDRWGIKSPGLKLTEIHPVTILKVGSVRQCTEKKWKELSDDADRSDRGLELADGVLKFQPFVTTFTYAPNQVETFDLIQGDQKIQLTQSHRIKIPNDHSAYGRFIGFKDKANCLKLIGQ